MSDKIYRETSTYAKGVIFLDCYAYEGWSVDYSEDINNLIDIVLTEGSLSVVANDVETVMNGDNPLMQFSEGDKVKITALEENTKYKTRWAVKNPPPEPSEEPAPAEEPASVVPE